MAAASVDRIAHYRILRRVGRGGMGIVYRAVDERDGREVALKVIRGSEAASDESAPHVSEARQRFTREAEILKALLHVNVVAFYEIGEEDGTPYLAMEFLDGRPLGAFAGRPYTETLPLFIQAAHGLAYLASRNIVHRDLSPDNIFVVDKGGDQLVKLLDFGVAKLFETPTGLESLTATGFFLGKVAYGSPEQLGYLGHGAPLDWRSDVYSLGVIFYEVLAGRRPFEGKAPVEYIAAHLNTAPPPVAAPPESPSLPVGLVRLVGQMLEKRREDRPRSWRAIVDGLVAVLRDSGRPGAVSSADLRDPGDLTRPTEMVISRETPALPAPARGSLGSPLARSAVGLVLLALALGLFLLRELRRPAAEDAAAEAPARATPEAMPAGNVPAAAGQLRLLATPYARVVSVTALGSGRTVPLPLNAMTPFVVPQVAPGRYRVVLSCPALDDRSVEREVTVDAGRPALVAEAFLPPEALLETLR